MLRLWTKRRNSIVIQQELGVIGFEYVNLASFLNSNQKCESFSHEQHPIPSTISAHNKQHLNHELSTRREFAPFPQTQIFTSKTRNRKPKRVHKRQPSAIDSKWWLMENEKVESFFGGEREERWGKHQKFRKFAQQKEKFHPSNENPLDFVNPFNFFPRAHFFCRLHLDTTLAEGNRSSAS